MLLLAYEYMNVDGQTVLPCNHAVAERRCSDGDPEEDVGDQFAGCTDEVCGGGGWREDEVQIVMGMDLGMRISLEVEVQGCLERAWVRSGV